MFAKEKLKNSYCFIRIEKYSHTHLLFFYCENIPILCIQLFYTVIKRKLKC